MMSKYPFSTEKSITLVDIIKWRGEHQHEDLAYTYLEHGEIEKGSTTYGELDQRARDIAIQFAAQGLQLNDRILLLFPTGLNYITAFVGCLYAGVIAVPAYPPQRKRYISRLHAIIDDANPTAILTEKSTVTELAAVLKEHDSAANIKTIIMEENISLKSDSIKSQRITPEAPAFLQYTSGSTSLPKGVIVNHRNLIYNEEMIRRGMGHDENSIFVSWLPLFHDMGLIGNMLQPLYVGTHCIIMSPEAFLQKPLRWLKAISNYKAHTSGAPNFAYDLCAEQISEGEKHELDLSHWQIAYNGSEPVHGPTLSRFFNAFSVYGFKQQAFYPCYGLAEATLFVSGGVKESPPREIYVEKSALERNQIIVHTNKSEDSTTLVSCGNNWLDQNIVIVNSDTLNPCKNGQVGEIWLAGSNIAHGYWQKPDQNKEIFNATLNEFEKGPFLRTGDLGFIDNSELFITGRRKDLIVIRGANHYPQDIEYSVTKSHPALANGNGAAFSIEDKNCERLVITFEIDRSYVRSSKFDEIFEAIRRVIATDHDLQVFAMDLLKPGKIAKTSSGKIQRHLCRKGFLDKTITTIGKWRLPKIDSNSRVTCDNTTSSVVGPPWTRDAIAAWLTAELSEGLQVNAGDINVTQSFAHYGLDSSVAIMLTGELSSILDCELQPVIFWEYPTIKQLSEYLAEVVSH